jgi:hypothetical protein
MLKKNNYFTSMLNIDNFPKNENHFIKTGQDKIKKVAKIGALGLGIGSGVIAATNEAGAQEVKPLNMEIIINAPKIINTDIKPEDYDFRNKGNIDLKDLEEKKNLDSTTIHRTMLEALKRTRIHDNYWSAGMSLANAENDSTNITREIKSIEKRGELIPSELTQRLIEAKKRIQRSREKFNFCKEEEKKAKNLKFNDINITLTDRDKEYLKLTPALFKQLERARQEAKRLIDDESNLKKIKNEFHCSLKEARHHQQVRLSNIDLTNYDLLTVQELRDSLSRSNDNFHNAIAYANRDQNKITIPYDLRREFTEPGYEFSQADFEKEIYLTALHEFLHLATGANRGLSPHTVDLLSKTSFKKYSPEEIKNNLENNNYYSDPTERYVRFKSLESELENFGSKKIGENFTLEHYQKVIALYRDGKLWSDANELIKYTQNFDTDEGYKIFKRMFDEIALLDTPENNGKTYFHPNWDYVDNEDKA